jgi:hypothetical protein
MSVPLPQSEARTDATASAALLAAEVALSAAESTTLSNADSSSQSQMGARLSPFSCWGSSATPSGVQASDAWEKCTQ